MLLFLKYEKQAILFNLSVVIYYRKCFQKRRKGGMYGTGFSSAAENAAG